MLTLTSAPLAAYAYWGQGLSKEFLDGAFKGLFSKRKIARELLPLLKPKVERKPCEGKEGKSEKTCDELGEELLIAGRRDDVDEVSCRCHRHHHRHRRHRRRYQVMLLPADRKCSQAIHLRFRASIWYWYWYWYGRYGYRCYG